MFSNYELGVTISPIECGCSNTTADTDKFIVKDYSGNVIGLQWSPVDRFSLELNRDVLCGPEYAGAPNDDSVISVSIYNHRGESIFYEESSDNPITIEVNDSLSDILLQGFYKVDICKSTKEETKLIKRLSLSIGYNN